jgi:aspartate kinase
MTADPLIVQKYGGSSLSNPSRIRHVAAKIARRAHGNTRIIVTVSAMGHSTDDLIALAEQITPNPPQRELDMLLTAGERVSMALLSMALNALGCRAISFTGSQSGIVTTVSHTRALIQEIRADRIRVELERGKVVIVAGFQGVSRDREVTTLGRGGSDTTAVALAAALQAARCEIYSDYPGVFTADPRSVPSAKAIARISYDEMLELAALGARVLHYRAAELARRFQVPLQLLSSFEDSSGTAVGNGEGMEDSRPTSITSIPRAAVVRFETSDAAALDDLFARLAGLDQPITSYSRESRGNVSTVSLVLNRDDLAALEGSIGSTSKSKITVEVRRDVAAVAVVGSGFACNAGAFLRIERLLSEAGIPVVLSRTSSLAVTCVVAESDCKRAVDALHSALFTDSHGS